MATNSPGAGKPRGVRPESVIRSLSRVGPMGPEVVKALAMPPALFDVGKPGHISFSSDPESSASSVSGCFYLGLPLPAKIPGYAIDVSAKGGILYCTLVDSKRRIIISSPLGSTHGRAGDWVSVELGIKRALREASTALSGGKRFGFVLVGDDVRFL